MEDQCYNEAYVGKVLEQFMNLTYNDFAMNTSPDLIGASTDALFGINEISELAKGEFTYTDMCSLLDDVARNNEYTTYLDRIQRVVLNTEFQQFEFRVWNEMLQSASQSLIEAKLFLVLPMEWFCQYLMTHASDRKAMKCEVDKMNNLVNKIYQTTKKVFRGSATIEEVLKMAVNVTRECWRPDGASLESYKQRILAAHSVIAHLLVYSFKTAYPERFGIEKTWNE